MKKKNITFTRREMYFWIMFKYKKNLNVIRLFWLIWVQTELSLVINQSEMCDYFLKFGSPEIETKFGFNLVWKAIKASCVLNHTFILVLSSFFLIFIIDRFELSSHYISYWKLLYIHVCICMLFEFFQYFQTGATPRGRTMHPGRLIMMINIV